MTNQQQHSRLQQIVLDIERVHMDAPQTQTLTMSVAEADKIVRTLRQVHSDYWKLRKDAEDYTAWEMYNTRVFDIAMMLRRLGVEVAT